MNVELSSKIVNIENNLNWLQSKLCSDFPTDFILYYIYIYIIYCIQWKYCSNSAPLRDATWTEKNITKTTCNLASGAGGGGCCLFVTKIELAMAFYCVCVCVACGQHVAPISERTVAGRQGAIGRQLPSKLCCCCCSQLGIGVCVAGPGDSVACQAETGVAWCSVVQRDNASAPPFPSTLARLAPRLMSIKCRDILNNCRLDLSIYHSCSCSCIWLSTLKYTEDLRDFGTSCCSSCCCCLSCAINSFHCEQQSK